MTEKVYNLFSWCGTRFVLEQGIHAYFVTLSLNDLAGKVGGKVGGGEGERGRERFKKLRNGVKGLLSGFPVVINGAIQKKKQLQR